MLRRVVDGDGRINWLILTDSIPFAEQASRSDSPGWSLRPPKDLTFAPTDAGAMSTLG